MARSAIDLVSDLLPIGREEIEQMIKFLVSHPQLGARDAIHLACLRTQGIPEIVSLDRDFDQFQWIRRRSL